MYLSDWRIWFDNPLPRYYVMIVTGFFACQWLKMSGSLSVPNFNVYTTPQFLNNMMTVLGLAHIVRTSRFGNAGRLHAKDTYNITEQAFFYLGALGFYGLGEVGQLDFAITGSASQVSRKFNWVAIQVFGSVIIFVVIVVFVNIIKSPNKTPQEKQRARAMWALWSISVAYTVSMWTWVNDTSATVSLHWHHAIIGGVASVMMRNVPTAPGIWGTLMRCIALVALGVMVQGVNAYGIGDLQFIEGSTGNPVSRITAMVTTIVLISIQGATWIARWRTSTRKSGPVSMQMSTVAKMSSPMQMSPSPVQMRSPTQMRMVDINFG
jgi:hypothetical protein